MFFCDMYPSKEKINLLKNSQSKRLETIKDKKNPENVPSATVE